MRTTVCFVGKRASQERGTAPVAPGYSDPCTFRWFGIGCVDPCDSLLDGPDCYFGRIVSINQPRNNLTGSLTNWTELGELHNLTTLDLQSNSIYGQIPTEIGLLSHLDLIDMRHNRLEGTIPAAMGGQDVLDTLAVEWNSISGTLP